MEVSNIITDMILEHMLLFSTIGILCLVKILLYFAIDAYQAFQTYIMPLIKKEEDFVKRYGKWAVVTGCTQGIGRSYVDELAKRGMNIVLISRNKERLEKFADHLTQIHQGNLKIMFFIKVFGLFLLCW